MKNLKNYFVTFCILLSALLLASNSFGQNDGSRIIGGYPANTVWPTSARITLIDENGDEYIITKNFQGDLSVYDISMTNIVAKPESRFKIELLGATAVTVQWYMNIVGMGMELEYQGRNSLILNEYLSNAQRYSVIFTAKVKSGSQMKTYNFKLYVGYGK